MKKNQKNRNSFFFLSFLVGLALTPFIVLCMSVYELCVVLNSLDRRPHQASFYRFSVGTILILEKKKNIQHRFKSS